MDEIPIQIDIELTVHIVSAYVTKNPVPVAELPTLIANVSAALQSVGSGQRPNVADFVVQKPAVPVKKSVTPDYIINLESGKKFKSMKRNLMSSYGMTPDQYRAKWDLPSDYPMVAPNYAAARSELAKKLGLGRKVKAIRTKATARRKKAA